MITPENVSLELLKDVLAAYTDTSFDEDGDLLVKGDCQVYVTIVPDKSSIRLMTIFRTKEDSSVDARLGAVNKINSDYMIVKAHCTDNQQIDLHLLFHARRRAHQECVCSRSEAV